MTKEIEVARMSFGNEQIFYLYLNREHAGYYRITTFLSRELLEEIKNDPNALDYAAMDLKLLLKRGAEQL